MFKSFKTTFVAGLVAVGLVGQLFAVGGNGVAGGNVLPKSEVKEQAAPATVEVKGEEKKEQTVSFKAELKASEAYKSASLKEKIVLKKVAKKLDETQLSPAQVKKIAEATSQAGTKAGDNQLVALLLCFFLGGLGVHRFYLGYTWQGVVQLLTAGGCGIWALIDFIRIIIGDLEPKDGSYSKTL